MSKVCLQISILLLLSSAASIIFLYSEKSCPFFECPTDDSYPQTCLDKAIPPWPICKFGTVDHFVDKAEDAASRCCGDDLSECKCPHKDSDKFLDEIDAWCDGVSSCDEGRIGSREHNIDHIVLDHGFEGQDYVETE